MVDNVPSAFQAILASCLEDFFIRLSFKTFLSFQTLKHCFLFKSTSYQTNHNSAATFGIVFFYSTVGVHVTIHCIGEYPVEFQSECRFPCHHVCNLNITLPSVLSTFGRK